jgi:uncharacterized protein YbjT (DUF2867 family)
VPDTELRTITVDYTIEFARLLHANSPNAVFSFLSGNGADPTGRSRIRFARHKGEAENGLVAANFPHVYVFRPAYIYPVEPRKEPSFSYRLLCAIYPAFRLLFPSQVIRADDLARVMIDVLIREAGEQGSGFREPQHPKNGRCTATRRIRGKSAVTRRSYGSVQASAILEAGVFAQCVEWIRRP